MTKDILQLIDGLIENAEYHYHGPDEQKYMDGYLDGLKMARQEIEKKLLTNLKMAV